MRDADTGHDPRCANRARTNANLDGIGARIDQRLGAFDSGDISGHYLNFVRLALDARHRVEHIFGMAVSGVDDDQIDTGRNQRFRAHKSLVADRRSSRYT